MPFRRLIRLNTRSLAIPTLMMVLALGGTALPLKRSWAGGLVDMSNTAPVTAPFATSTWSGRSIITRPAPAFDNDGDAVTYSLDATALPQGGEVALETSSTDGLFLYTPRAGFTGSDSFVLKASDGRRSTPLTVTVQVSEAPAAQTNIYTNLGSSDALGAGASDYSKGYTSLLRSRLNSMLGTSGWAHSNRGVDGFTAADLLRTIHGKSVLSLTTEEAPRAVSLWLGQAMHWLSFALALKVGQRKWSSSRRITPRSSQLSRVSPTSL